jgi:hypothetical protein
VIARSNASLRRPKGILKAKREFLQKVTKPSLKRTYKPFLFPCYLFSDFASIGPNRSRDESAKGGDSFPAWGNAPGKMAQYKSSAESAIHQCVS